MTMRERIRLAIDLCAIAADTQGESLTSLEIADIALRELETPDEGMVEAGRQYLRVHVDSHAIADDAAGAYTTMIRSIRAATPARKDGK